MQIIKIVALNEMVINVDFSKWKHTWSLTYSFHFIDQFNIHFYYKTGILILGRDKY